MNGRHDVPAHAASHSAGFATALRCQISILMPVFNTPAAYLAECWDSIRTQTFREWELVLVDDGSQATDTIAAIDRIALDPRVVLIRLDKNQGIAHALNLGLSRCRAEFVARMDADDRMMPTRLERQFAYLQGHPEVTVLGAQLQMIDLEQCLQPATQHPAQVTEEYIERQSESGGIWFVNHPTVMLRRGSVLKLGGYPPYRTAEDLGLWLKLAKAGLQIHNLPTVELHYRLHATQISRIVGLRREDYARIVAECWKPQRTVRAKSA